MNIKNALNWLIRYARGFKTSENEDIPLHSFDLTKETSDTLIKYLRDKIAEDEARENCPYCHLDDEMKCTQEWFSHPDGIYDLGISCGFSEVCLLIKDDTGDSVIYTQGKYCPYCGRKIT